MNTHVLHVWSNGILQPPVAFKSYQQASDYRDVLQKAFNGKVFAVFIILELTNAL